MSWQLPEYWAVVVLASDWAIRLGMLTIVPMRRGPTAAMAWLLLIFAFPWIGLAAYLLIGSTRLPRAREEQRLRLVAHLDRLLVRLQGDEHVQRPALRPEFEGAIRLAERLGRMPIVAGNSAELLADYDGTIDRLVTDIDEATDHVHLLFYIFADDATGRRIGEALARAAGRGVACRVMIDTAGTGSATLRRLLPRLRAAGVEAHETLPLGVFRRKAARFDLRNHRKIAVIDARTGYTGSQNIVDSFGDDELWNDEMVVRLEGPIVLQLQACFVADWYTESDELLDDPRLWPTPTARGTVAAQVLPSGPAFPSGSYLRLLVSLVHGAHERVILTTPYFIPDEALTLALVSAVMRGVRVDLVVSKQLDSRLVALAQESYYDELLRGGVRVHRLRERFLHAKYATIDDTIAVIGSGNLDIRSFRLNAEVSVVCYDAAVASQLRAEAERTIGKAESLEAESWAGRGRALRAVQNVARLLSPLL